MSGWRVTQEYSVRLTMSSRDGQHGSMIDGSVTLLLLTSPAAGCKASCACDFDAHDAREDDNSTHHGDVSLTRHNERTWEMMNGDVVHPVMFCNEPSSRRSGKRNADATNVDDQTTKTKLRRATFLGNAKSQDFMASSMACSTIL